MNIRLKKPKELIANAVLSESAQCASGSLDEEIVVTGIKNLRKIEVENSCCDSCLW